MNNIQLMEIIQQHKDHSATVQDVENAVKEFAAEIKKQNDGWISIKDRLPIIPTPFTDEDTGFIVTPTDVDVLVSDGRDVWFGCYYPEILGRWKSLNVTHWKPLPTPPKTTIK
jgi:hypothetical protein